MSLPKKSIKQILKDVITDVKDGLKMGEDYYDYDRLIYQNVKWMVKK